MKRGALLQLDLLRRPARTLLLDNDLPRETNDFHIPRWAKWLWNGRMNVRAIATAFEFVVFANGLLSDDLARDWMQLDPRVSRTFLLHSLSATVAHLWKTLRARRGIYVPTCPSMHIEESCGNQNSQPPYPSITLRLTYLSADAVGTYHSIQNGVLW